MKRERRIWRYFFLSLLIPFTCLLILQYAQASISVQVLNSFSDEIQKWQNKGYELDEVVITDLSSKECIIATFSFAEYWINGILKVYEIKEDEIVPLFEKKFDDRLVDLEVRDINGDWSDEIIVGWSTGGNSWIVNGIAIFEMHNGSIAPIKVIPPIISRLINVDDFEIHWSGGTIPSAYLADLDGDKVCELLVLDTTFENHYGEPVAWRVFSWKNGSYQEDCSSFPFYYEKKIDELKKELELELPSPSSLGEYSLKKPISLYLNYYYKGEAEKGFKELAKLILNKKFVKFWEAERKKQKWLEPLSDIVENLLSKYPL